MTISFFSMQSTNVSNVTGDSTVYQVIFDQVQWNNNCGYNNSTGIFSANYGNYYIIQGNITLTGITVLHTGILVELVTSSTTYNLFNSQGLILTSSVYQIPFSQLVNMNYPDTAYIQVTVSGSSKTIGISGSASIPITSFSAVLQS